jgi:L-amino acid N-acyltransferase YncA
LQKVSLRNAEERDFERILEILNEALTTSTATFESLPQTLESRRGWFQEHGQKYPLIVAEIEGRVVGYCSISSFARNSGYSKTVELSVYVDRSFRRQGIARSLVQEIIRKAKELGYHVILSSISKDNEASRKLHDVLGFEYVGCFKEVGWKFQKWQDTTFYELLL